MAIAFHVVGSWQNWTKYNFIASPYRCYILKSLLKIFCRPHQIMCNYTSTSGKGWMASRTSCKCKFITYLLLLKLNLFVSAVLEAGNSAELLEVTCRLPVTITTSLENERVVLRVHCENHLQIPLICPSLYLNLHHGWRICWIAPLQQKGWTGA